MFPGIQDKTIQLSHWLSLYSLYNHLFFFLLELSTNERNPCGNIQFFGTHPLETLRGRNKSQGTRSAPDYSIEFGTLDPLCMVRAQHDACLNGLSESGKCQLITFLLLIWPIELTLIYVSIIGKRASAVLNHGEGRALAIPVAPISVSSALQSVIPLEPIQVNRSHLELQHFHFLYLLAWPLNSFKSQ